jgi:hypothetical protein
MAKYQILITQWAVDGDCITSTIASFDTKDEAEFAVLEIDDIDYIGINISAVKLYRED